jgi:hypothetical protein
MPRRTTNVTNELKLEEKLPNSGEATMEVAGKVGGWSRN